MTLVERVLAEGSTAGGVDEHDAGIGIDEDVSESLAGIGGVEGDVGAAGLEDGEQSDDHGAGALEADADAGIGLHAESDELVRELVGAGVELGIAEGLLLEHEGDGVGRALDLLLELLVKADVLGIRRAGGVPLMQQQRALGFRQQPGLSNRHVGTVRIRQALREFAQMRAHPFDLFGIQTIRVVNPAECPVRPDLQREQRAGDAGIDRGFVGLGVLVQQVQADCPAIGGVRRGRRAQLGIPVDEIAGKSRIPAKLRQLGCHVRQDRRPGLGRVDAQFDRDDRREIAQGPQCRRLMRGAPPELERRLAGQSRQIDGEQRQQLTGPRRACPVRKPCLPPARGPLRGGMARRSLEGQLQCRATCQPRCPEGLAIGQRLPGFEQRAGLCLAQGRQPRAFREPGFVGQRLRQSGLALERSEAADQQVFAAAGDLPAVLSKGDQTAGRQARASIQSLDARQAHALAIAKQELRAAERVGAMLPEVQGAYQGAQCLRAVPPVEVGARGQPAGRGGDIVARLLRGFVRGFGERGQGSSIQGSQEFDETRFRGLLALQRQRARSVLGIDGDRAGYRRGPRLPARVDGMPAGRMMGLPRQQRRGDGMGCRVGPRRGRRVTIGEAAPAHALQQRGRQGRLAVHRKQPVDPACRQGRIQGFGAGRARDSVARGPGPQPLVARQDRFQRMPGREDVRGTVGRQRAVPGEHA